MKIEIGLPKENIKYIINISPKGKSNTKRIRFKHQQKNLTANS